MQSINEDSIRMLNIVKKYHIGQTRNGNKSDPYWKHCVGVSNILINTITKSGDNYSEAELKTMILAALGHDLYEDTSIKRKEIIETFGIDVDVYIFELSNEKSDEDRYDYEQKLKKSDEVIAIIKYCDMLENITSVKNNIRYLEKHWVTNWFLPIIYGSQNALADMKTTKYPKTICLLRARIAVALIELETAIKSQKINKL